MNFQPHYCLIATFLFLACSNSNERTRATGQPLHVSHDLAGRQNFDSIFKTIHVFVALCDNKYQGIVPVPARIGNGQDPNSNLYWGCGYGVRSYFKNSKSWKFLKQFAVDTLIMERLVFKNTKHNFYLVADAYNGKYIQQCTTDFLKSCSGEMKDTLSVNGTTIGMHGNAVLEAYIGHDGFMDFSLPGSFKNVDGKKRDAIILACISKTYFLPYLKQTNANPLVWSTGLMSPEAYTLHDALESYTNKEPVENIRNSAASAYSKFQHCSQKAARNLIVSGQ